MYHGKLISSAVKCAQLFRGNRMAANVRRLNVRNTLPVTCISLLCSPSSRSNYDGTHDAGDRKSAYFVLGSLYTLFGLLGSDEEPEQTPELVMTLKRSILLIQKKEYQQAEQMLHVALRLAQALQHHNGITYTYDLMANLAFDTGDYKKAETLFVTVLQRLVTNGIPENDMRVIHISLKVAKVLQKLGEAEKADLGYKFCLNHLEKLMVENKENKDILLLWAMTIDWYAEMMVEQNKLEEAYQYYLKAYDVCLKVNGEKHEKIVILLNDLGTVCSLMGEYEEAIKYLTKAVTIGKQLPDMYDYAAIYVNLGSVYINMQMYNKAQSSCKEGLKLSKARKDVESQIEAEECLKKLQTMKA